MRKKLLVFLALIFLLKTPVGAVPNNKIGIHLAVVSEQALKEATDLVNSSGGDWGYVTVVIQENDRSEEKWQRFFDKMRELHLIPIVRLATSPENSGWRQPKKEEAKAWADFLDSLNWVIKERYIILFNEPNFSKEWGDKVDPESYAQVALEFARVLKEKNSDFKVMLAGFDAAAPHRLPTYENERLFLQKMISAVGGPNALFQNIDYWASHSYQPSVYLNELNLLRTFGVGKSLSVFITEAGWPHAEGVRLDRSFLSASKLSQNFVNSFWSWLGDSRVIAVTPFVLDYQSEPFDHFSWKKLGDSGEFFPQYQAVQNISKIKGQPVQEQKLSLSEELPKKLTRNSTFHLPVVVKNEGQAVWSEADGYKLEMTDGKNFEYFFSNFENLFPLEEESLWLNFKTGEEIDKFELTLGVSKDGKIVSNTLSWGLETVPAVSLDLKASFFPFRKASGDDFKIVIYNAKEEVVFERSRISFSQGEGEVKEVNNLAIGGKYRVVLLKPYFLPRQAFLTVGEDKNEISFKPMLGLDFDLDGRLSGNDAVELLKEPKLLFRK